MKKPLELTVYPEGGCVTSADCALKEWCVECVDEVDKRLTDAELAAEYHSADVAFHRNIWQEMSRGEDWPDETWDRIAEPVNTFHRFATLPHYDAPTETGTQA